MYRYSHGKALLLMAGSGLFLMATACESSGGLRVAGVGNTPGVSSGGSTSSGGGSTSSGGSSQGSTGLAALPVGGVVGPNGVGDAGILPNVGDPNQPTALSPILVTAGNAVLGVSGAANGAGGTVPGTHQITGTVTQLLADTGQALVTAGNGQGYLVDGLTGAVGDAVTLTVANRTVTGPGGQAPLAGVSVLSPGHNQGTLATVGAASGNQLVTANVAPITGAGGNGALQQTASNVVGTVNSPLSGGAAGNPVQSVVGAVTPVTGALGVGAGGTVTTPGGSAGAGAGAGVGGSVGGTLSSVTGLLGSH